MKLESQDLEAFKQLWQESFGQTLSTQHAQEKATHLLQMMRAIYKPLPKPQEGPEQLILLELNPTPNEI